MNKIVTKYDILQGRPKDVAHEMNLKIAEGWQPLGPAISDSNEDCALVIQTIVKYDESESNWSE